MKKEKKKENRLMIKMFLCLIYLIIMTILFVCSYKLYQTEHQILPWSEVESTEDYAYMEITKMSEKFAFSEESNIGLHFVIVEEETGQWHTYIVAINEKDYDDYKDMIDYTYGRREKAPDSIKIFGYPVIIEQDMKELAIQNLPNFVPAENEIEITFDNYEKYLTNSYLDTTKEKKEEFNVILCISLFLLFMVILLLILTIMDKDKIVDSLEKEEMIPRKRPKKKVVRDQDVL